MPDTQLRQTVLKEARRIVVKVGTAALTDRVGRLDEQFISGLCRQVSGVVAGGVEVTLVSSGAIGAGMAELDLSEKPGTLPMLQAAAAVGQGQLMRTFHDAFASSGLKVAQILITRGDFEDRARYLNIRNTIAALHEMSVVPVVNENDTVAVDELEGRFGDNDIVAALLTNMLRADVLILLTVVDGVLSEGKVLDVIEDAGAGAVEFADDSISRGGSGGMGTKLQAAGMVTAAGEAAVIANARTPDVLIRLLGGEKLGTLCLPAEGKMSSRRRWIGQAARSAGKITVDDGAVKALREGGKSLLPSGITAVAGNFQKGDTVAVVDSAGGRVARGLTNYSAADVDAIKGLKTSQITAALGEKPYDEVVHRNNMVVE
ncbi:MAG: glutamate 5-kinase [Planctomycetota bacterium]|nr:glutamate 5-kinase [Planctomycetota bacterium]